MRPTPCLSQLFATCLRRVGERRKHGEGPAAATENREDGIGERGAGGEVTFAIVFLELRGAEAAGGAQRGAAHLHVAVHVCLGGRL